MDKSVNACFDNVYKHVITVPIQVDLVSALKFQSNSAFHLALALL